MPRKGYPTEFRRRALDLLAIGRKVVDVAPQVGGSLGLLARPRGTTATLGARPGVTGSPSPVQPLRGIGWLETGP
jgi:transposase-like protein